MLKGDVRVSSVYMSQMHRVPEMELTRIDVHWSTWKSPVPRTYLLSLQQIRSQCKHEWFTTICDMANISAHYIFRKFDQLDKEYCLSSRPVSEEPPRFESRWQIRRNKLKNKIRLLS